MLAAAGASSMLVLSNPNTYGPGQLTSSNLTLPQSGSGSLSSGVGGTTGVVREGTIILPPGQSLMFSPVGSFAAPVSLVTVGHPGNVADVTGFGAVGYTYLIGTHEVTNYQYTAFLNSVASSDPYGLYDPRMATTMAGFPAIVRSGESGSYRYSVSMTEYLRPVAYVGWFSAARFANWMHNGGYVGADTEQGAYVLNGATSGNVQRNSGAHYWLPTENEWYKAAYYSPTLNGGAGGYWRYPTQSNDVTLQTAVYSTPENQAVPDSVTLASAPSAFGTYSQGGNVWEYLDSNGVSPRWLRGGGATWGKNCLASYTDSSTYEYGFGWFDWQPPDHRQPDVGFRVAAKPANREPLGASFSTAPIAEGNAINAVVARFSASNVEPGETVTYKLATGYGSGDNAFFEIVGNELRAGIAFDYEAKTDYTVQALAYAPHRVGTLLTIPIRITNVAEPVDSVLFEAQPTVREGRLLSRIGTLRGGPIEATASTTFTLLGGDVGPAAGLFAINGDGLYAVSEAFRPNTEYQIRVRAADGLGTSIERDVAVSIVADPAVRVTRAPEAIGLSATRGQEWLQRANSID